MNTPGTQQAWEALRKSLNIEGQAFIDGRYCSAVSEESFSCVSPIDGTHLTDVAACCERDVDRAVAGARKAFSSGHWHHMPPAKKKKVLYGIADLIEKHADTFALLETLDMGKPINDSARIDIPLSAATFRYYAEALDKVYGEIAPTHPQAVALIRKEALGVIGAVVPWNFPLLMAAWKLAPALATGNSVVLKPAEQSPLTAIKLAALCVEAGLPEGVVQVVPGFGETAGQAIGRHLDVDMVAFTGSTEIGKLFLRYSGESNMKRIALECGGKSPHIIFDDCEQLKEAATAAAWGIFFNQGEVCNAGSRLFVHKAVKDEVLEELISWGKKLQPGDPLDPTTHMGAIVSKEQQDRILRYIDRGVSDGATPILQGGSAREHTGGFYVSPTVFDGVDNAMTIARDEIFGPVLSVISFEHEADVIEAANDTMYGLAAALWTDNLNRAHRVSRAIKAGTVWVNCFDQADLTVPFGGFKQSGFGRDKSLHAMDKYTDFKTTWMSIDMKTPG